MIVQVQHETRLEYSEPVAEWLAELRMEPINDEQQSCHSFHLAVSQPAPFFRYQDGFGNWVHHFNLLEPPPKLQILAASVVETFPDPPDLPASGATHPLDLNGAEPGLLDYLSFRGPVRRTDRLRPLLDQLPLGPGDRLGPFVGKVCRTLHEGYEYARNVTGAASPIDDILEHKKGVCQDFAHLMIAVLRHHGIPARYVSGYLHRPEKESQSHAWCEAWLPDTGWVGIDPTNNCPAGESFVRVAVGRDFTDVSPNKGVYRGQGSETMSARVETQLLRRLPSRSWKDQLPPLDVPLTRVALTPRGRTVDDSDEQAQQQQQ